MFSCNWTTKPFRLQAILHAHTPNNIKKEKNNATPSNQSPRKSRKYLLYQPNTFWPDCFDSSFPWGRVALYSPLSFGTDCSHQALWYFSGRLHAYTSTRTSPVFLKLWSQCRPLNPKRPSRMKLVKQLKCKVGELRVDSDNEKEGQHLQALAKVSSCWAIKTIASWITFLRTSVWYSGNGLSLSNAASLAPLEKMESKSWS